MAWDQRTSKLLSLLHEGSSEPVRSTAGRQLVALVQRTPRLAPQLISKAGIDWASLPWCQPLWLLNSLGSGSRGPG